MSWSTSRRSTRASRHCKVCPSQGLIGTGPSRGGHRLLGDGHQPARGGRLGHDAELLRVQLHAGPRETGSRAGPADVLRRRPAYRSQEGGRQLHVQVSSSSSCNNLLFVFRLELSTMRRRLAWEATPRSIHEGVAHAIHQSDCLSFDTSTAQLFAGAPPPPAP